ncbi:MAG: PEP-CTERM sorting domain-containing protein [Pirellulales bacterium]|nr:PEP-CTERM sorting domain-containing protein [Pirellulales bacterium]
MDSFLRFAVFACAYAAITGSLARAETIPKLYWAMLGDTMIRRANLDGSGHEDLIRTPGGIQPDIAIDPIENKMYWPSPAAGGIQRANLDGSNPEIVVSSLERPIRVALDSVNRKVYWYDTDENMICRSNLDGTDREILTSDIPSVSAIEVDPIGGFYYWSEKLHGVIRRATLDNSRTEIVLDDSAFGRDPWPTGITLDLASGYLYASDRVFEAIIRVGLDGSDPILWLTDGTEDPTSIVFDSVGQRIYWGNSYPDRHIMSASVFDGEASQEFLPADYSGRSLDYSVHLAMAYLPIPEPASYLLFLIVSSGFFVISIKLSTLLPMSCLSRVL